MAEQGTLKWFNDAKGLPPCRTSLRMFVRELYVLLLGACFRLA